MAYSLRLTGLAVLILGIGAGSLPAYAVQNGFGDTMTAGSYFPMRSLAAFGGDDPGDGHGGALVASTAGTNAVTLNAIVPAAGIAVRRPPNPDDAELRGIDPYGPFQPGQEPAAP